MTRDDARREREPNRRPIHVFFISAITAAGCMFVFKLFSFLKTIKRDELAGFAFDPIMVYAFVAGGFLLLLGWAFLTGQFRDVEGPKYEMLKRFEEQERAERIGLRPERLERLDGAEAEA